MRTRKAQPYYAVGTLFVTSLFSSFGTTFWSEAKAKILTCIRERIWHHFDAKIRLLHCGLRIILKKRLKS